MDQMEVFVDKPEVDVGVVVSVDKHFDGMEVVMSEEGSEFELGFSLYFDQFSQYVRVFKGDKLEMVGHGDPEGIRKLTVNDSVYFDYNKEQARIIKEIRKRRREIAQLQEELNGRAG